MSRNWCSLVVAVASLALLLLHPWIARSPAPPVAKQRVLFVTLEYADPIFSGNGVLSRTMVNALLALDYEVLVVCAVPSTSASDLLSSSSSAEHALQRFNGSSGTSHSLLSVAVPVSKWLRLDRHSAWQEFAMGMASLRSQVEAFGVDIVMAVDWSGWHALERLKDLWRSKPAYFLNFRVFSRSTELLQSDGDRRFYADHECCALANSTSTIALSCYDACRLHALCQSCPGGSLGAGVAAGLDPSRATIGELSAESPDGCMRHCARAARQAVALSVLRPPVRSDMLRVGRTHRRRTRVVTPATLCHVLRPKVPRESKHFPHLAVLCLKPKVQRLVNNYCSQLIMMIREILTTKHCLSTLLMPYVKNKHSEGPELSDLS
eukprot:scpid41979/ scgid1621/ 